jgi:glucokinase
MLCVDLGGTIIKAGAVQGKSVLATRRMEANAQLGLRPQLGRLKSALTDIAHEVGIRLDQCGGLGVAFPALVDSRSNRLLALLHQKYADAMEVDIIKWASDELHLPARMENDAHAALLGEWKFGAGRGCDDVMMVTLGTGIGTSVILRGKLLRGADGQAGVLGGHFIVAPGAEPCGCGGRGCFETECGLAALVRVAKADPAFAASELASEPKLDFFALFQAVRNHDALALQLRERFIRYWSAALVSYIHAFDVSRIILCGGVMHSQDVILHAIAKHVEQWAWTPWGKVQIVAAELGDSAALVGLGVLLGQTPLEYI